MSTKAIFKVYGGVCAVPFLSPRRPRARPVELQAGMFRRLDRVAELLRMLRRHPERIEQDRAAARRLRTVTQKVSPQTRAVEPGKPLSPGDM